MSRVTTALYPGDAVALPVGDGSVPELMVDPEELRAHRTNHARAVLGGRHGAQGAR